MYEVVNHGSSITATTARSEALARSINGVSGYLANITSSEENSFVAARITQDGWFGASDASVEGDWVWRDGPEAGTLFWRGTAGGTAFGYENWAGGEPNQSGEEDCSEFYANGSGWNDLPCGHAGISTYIVEYGAPGNLPNIASDTLDITLSADTVTQAPTMTSPISDSIQNTLQLTYSLPEVPTASTVNVSFNNGTTTTTLTMSNDQSVSTTLNLSNLASSSGVTGVTANSLADGTYTVTLSYQDYLGNPVSTDIESGVVIDTTLPTITNISSNKVDGSYTAGEVIDIDVTFSEIVSSTGNITVTLETGTTDRTCTFVVIAGTTGTCEYVVQAGDSSSDLTVVSISGIITDSASNTMNNLIPATNLAINKAIMIDAVPPVISSISSQILHSPGSAISWTTDEGATSQIEYGITDTYGSTTTIDNALITNHTVNIFNLI